MAILGAGALTADYDVCVIGAGPAGLACALRACANGLRVLVLEAGDRTPVPGNPDLLNAEIADSARHDPVELVSAAALGGTSHWWGGGCMALDPADMRFWPIDYEDMSRSWREAADFFGTVTRMPSPPPGAFSAMRGFDAEGVQAICPEFNTARQWQASIEAPEGPAVVLNARVHSLVISNGAVESARVLVEGVMYDARARNFVLAGGGLGSLKLLLLAQHENQTLFGGAGGPLGRFYMGHLAGSIADIAPKTLADIDAFRIQPMAGGGAARRVIRAGAETILAAGVGSTFFRLDQTARGDAAHGNAALSAKYLAARLLRRLSTAESSGPQPSVWPHLRNILSAPFAAFGGLVDAAIHLMRRAPPSALDETITPSSKGRWRLKYHAEHKPHWDSRVRLSDTSLDSIGNPRLHIDLRFKLEDFESVLRAHELLDAALQEAGAGRLVWSGTRDAMLAKIDRMAHDGYHQIGGAAMSAAPEDGVVNAACRTHDVANLYVASSCVFPSSGHANPTLTIVALAQRVADEIARTSKASEQTDMHAAASA